MRLGTRRPYFNSFSALQVDSKNFSLGPFAPSLSAKLGEIMEALL